jgi:hypothetical protein
MVNQSKVNDPRFWKKWKDSWAVETIKSKLLFTNPDDSLEVYCAKLWHKEGNLSMLEAATLAKYNFREHPETVSEQVDQLHLAIKCGNPAWAQQIKDAAQPILDRGIRSSEDVGQLCNALAIANLPAIIRFNGQMYVSKEGNLATLKFMSYPGCTYEIVKA